MKLMKQFHDRFNRLQVDVVFNRTLDELPKIALVAVDSNSRASHLGFKDCPTLIEEIKGFAFRCKNLLSDANIEEGCCSVDRVTGLILDYLGRLRELVVEMVSKNELYIKA